MKLALEHLQKSIAQTERALSDARDGLKASQAQLDGHTQGVARLEGLLTDLRAALGALRATVPVETPSAPIIDQLKKTELSDRQPRATLTRKGN